MFHKIDMNYLDDYISRKHLRLYPDTREVVFLCYKMHVTETEYEILKAMLSTRKKWFCAKDISAMLGGKISEQSIANHICNINSKAKHLGGRKLIKNMVQKGYFFNEEM